MSRIIPLVGMENEIRIENPPLVGMIGEITGILLIKVDTRA